MDGKTTALLQGKEAINQRNGRGEHVGPDTPILQTVNGGIARVSESAEAIRYSRMNALHGVISSKRIRFAEFWFTDMRGKPWRITMPADRVSSRLFEDGLPLDGQPIGGMWNGVMRLIPRFDAIYFDPTATGPSLMMMCDLLDDKTKSPIPLEPRHVLARAVEYARGRLDAELTMGIEPEFTLMNGDGRPVAEDALWEFLRSLAKALNDAGIQVEWFRTGPGEGQGRVQMAKDVPLLTADRVIGYKHFARNIARSKGLSISFLPKPLPGGPTPGMPMHFSAWQGGRNLFHDRRGWALTSAMCRAFARGILTHVPSLAALCAPSMNSYRRLIRGVSGPTRSLLSQVDPMAVCRIPARSPSPDARRVKFCSADCTANPYLAAAAVILAGVDGVEKGFAAPVDGSPPLGVRMPHSLESALDSFTGDREYLRAGGSFSDALIQAWIKDRWIHSILPARSHPHPWEISHGEDKLSYAA